MLYTIGREMFHSFINNMWIGNLGALCHKTNDDTGLNDITKINKLAQESSGHLSIPKGKL